MTCSLRSLVSPAFSLCTHSSCPGLLLQHRQPGPSTAMLWIVATPGCYSVLQASSPLTFSSKCICPESQGSSSSVKGQNLNNEISGLFSSSILGGGSNFSEGRERNFIISLCPSLLLQPPQIQWPKITNFNYAYRFCGAHIWKDTVRMTCLCSMTSKTSDEKFQMAKRDSLVGGWNHLETAIFPSLVPVIG